MRLSCGCSEIERRKRERREKSCEEKEEEEMKDGDTQDLPSVGTKCKRTNEGVHQTHSTIIKEQQMNVRWIS